MEWDAVLTAWTPWVVIRFRTVLRPGVDTSYMTRYDQRARVDRVLICRSISYLKWELHLVPSQVQRSTLLAVEGSGSAKTLGLLRRWKRDKECLSMRRRFGQSFQTHVSHVTCDRNKLLLNHFLMNRKAEFSAIESMFAGVAHATRRLKFGQGIHPWSFVQLLYVEQLQLEFGKQFAASSLCTH